MKKNPSKLTHDKKCVSVRELVSLLRTKMWTLKLASICTHIYTHLHQSINPRTHKRAGVNHQPVTPLLSRVLIKLNRDTRAQGLPSNPLMGIYRGAATSLSLSVTQHTLSLYNKIKMTIVSIKVGH